MPDQNLIKSAWSSRGRGQQHNISNIKKGNTSILCLQFIRWSMQHAYAFTWLFSVIGFYAAYIWWFLRHQNLHQFSQTELELCGSLSRENKTSFLCKFMYSMCLFVWLCLCSSNRLWPSLVHQLIYIECLIDNVIPWLTQHLQWDTEGLETHTVQPSHHDHTLNTLYLFQVSVQQVIIFVQKPWKWRDNHYNHSTKQNELWVNRWMNVLSSPLTL